MAARRQLPILHQPAAPAAGTVPAPDDPDERPPWHWSAIGALLIFVSWLPLGMVAQWATALLVPVLVPGSSLAEVSKALASATPERRVLLSMSLAAMPLLGFVAACLVGGGLVGRFGGKAGVREAAVAGVVAASTAWALTAAGVGLGSTWMLWPPIALVGLGAGWLGGRLGVRAR